MRIGELPPWKMKRKHDAAAFARAAIREAQLREAKRIRRRTKEKELAIPPSERRARKEMPRHGKLPLTGNESRDLCGRTFGYITAIEPAYRLKSKASRMTYWRCRCGLCGKLFDTQRQSLLCRSIRSCGSKGCNARVMREASERNTNEAKKTDYDCTVHNPGSPDQLLQRTVALGRESAAREATSHAVGELRAGAYDVADARAAGHRDADAALSGEGPREGDGQ